MKILEKLDNIIDPRDEAKIDYPLSSIIFITLCAVLCKAESWKDVVLFGESKEEWLKNYIDLANGIPSEWTFRRIFILLPPNILEKLLTEHASDIVTDKEDQIAIDGKALRGSRGHGFKALQSVSAWSINNSLVLGERSVEEKSNEITAIPELIKLLDLNGCTITIDAMGCQKSIVKDIINNDAEYVLGLKKNHPKLYKIVSNHMQQNSINPEHCLGDDFEYTHGRLTRRRCFSCSSDEIDNIPDEWLGLKSFVAIECINKTKNSDVTAEWRYYISSHDANNQKLPLYIRNHWGIENSLHWVLDVNMGEDADKKAERNSAKAFGVLKRIALNIVRTKDKSKGSIKGKLKKAGWSNKYLLSLLK